MIFQITKQLIAVVEALPVISKQMVYDILNNLEYNVRNIQVACFLLINHFKLDTFVMALLKSLPV